MDARDRPDLRHRLADALTAVRRRVLRRRRLIAVALLGVAVAASLRALAPPAPATTALLVAAHDLPAGAVLGEGDLVARGVPPDVVPQGAVAHPHGRVLAAPLRAGEAVTDVRLLGAGLARVAQAGTRAVPVRLSDAAQAALLQVGDRIDLLGTDPTSGSTQVLARASTVLAVPPRETSGDGGLAGRLVVLALRAVDVAAVTAASVRSYVTYAWARD
ncbi:pilus assembly protein CpaB [Nocardioides sp. zg-536]|uniref:Pilus assembly protein CpaB n=1 Tax=Nocardioides faecalis TaxID=2803858 RepID=A0A938Y7T4_9ACTN|nr:SAF domain-containing protein [Nocardioides faecalis]MBM9460865.1 pilus assembly protein CpaB [Nocardioides faecalis]MBS4751840.1 pilus assembly protein CpaB [Nocardioides faecalis]QVI59306.1 pilus assembly protein CpaB [Nocardioides faecalis]